MEIVKLSTAPWWMLVCLAGLPALAQVAGMAGSITTGTL